MRRVLCLLRSRSCACVGSCSCTQANVARGSNPLCRPPRTWSIFVLIARRALEAIVNGRADGTAGPTLGSFFSALIKTGGSGVVMYAFFHGLKQMSVSEVADSERLPAGGGGGS